MSPAVDAPHLPFFDINDPAFSLRSPEVKAAREAGPYARTPYGIAVLRYAEASDLINDKRLIQGSARWSEHNGIAGEWARWWGSIVLNREGADHVRLRKLVNPAFSSKHVASMVPAFQRLAGELIDGFVDDGRCEFMRQFAEPYATRVICQLLGVDESRWKEIAAWSEQIGIGLSITGRDRVEEMEHGLARMLALADDLIAARRAAPHDDFLQSLVDAHADGERLTDEELRDTVALLVFGGIDTTRNQLGLGIDLFVRHPDQWALLREHPEYAANAVEEIMRVRPTTMWTTREANEDLELDGIAVPRGTTIHLISESTGTDPARFPDPSFDITQADRPKHFAFGGGRHYCLGHFIARGDMTEAFTLLARRLGPIEHDAEPEFLPDSGNTGPVTMPIRFAPGGVA
jgi:cytochrome P450